MHRAPPAYGNVIRISTFTYNVCVCTTFVERIEGSVSGHGGSCDASDKCDSDRLSITIPSPILQRQHRIESSPNRRRCSSTMILRLSDRRRPIVAATRTASGVRAACCRCCCYSQRLAVGSEEPPDKLVVVVVDDDHHLPDARRSSRRMSPRNGTRTQTWRRRLSSSGDSTTVISAEFIENCQITRIERLTIRAYTPSRSTSACASCAPAC